MLAATIIPSLESTDAVKGFSHWCNACGMEHSIIVRRNGSGQIWSFNYDYNEPTFTPSVRVTVGKEPDGTFQYCHYYIKAGMIEYCNDSFHHLKGQTVPLPPFPVDYLDQDELAQALAFVK